MKLLLDTHVFLWWLADDRRLRAPARRAIESPANEVLVSAASVWEMAIKIGSNKLELAAPERLPDLITEAGFRELPVFARHAAAVRALPPHHSDPFDRLLVAQAQVEHATLVSSDPQIARYDVVVLA